MTIQEIEQDVRERFDNAAYGGVIPVWRVHLLYEMAKEDIYPDGTFADCECVIWELFRR